MKPDNCNKQFIRTFSLVIIYFGIIIWLSSIIINPWLSMIFISPQTIMDRSDVIYNYFICSSLFAVYFIFIGILVKFKKTNASVNLSLLSLIILSIVLIDKLLLVYFGLPLWIPDSNMHYRHRPGATRTWKTGKTISINKYGHHDANFSKNKNPGEFRLLVLGDSIAMGHGMHFSDTFSSELEKLLNKNDIKYNKHKVINTGVQGFSTRQEYYMLKESLVFKPDIVCLGFCMNDVMEPFYVDISLGGDGLDYHGVQQIPNYYLMWLINETGYGRLIQSLKRKLLKRPNSRPFELQTGREWDLSIVQYMTTNKSDPKVEKGWQIVLDNLEMINETCKNRGIIFVLMIFPHTIQLFDDKLLYPQQVLKNFAERNGIDIIDFTDIFTDILVKPEDKLVITFLRGKGFSIDDILKLYDSKIKKYYLDYDHYTVYGHNIVAQTMFNFLYEKKLITVHSGN